jgi:predicted Zn-dependent peptidase
MDSVLTAGSTKKGISIVPNLLTGDAAKDRFNARLVKNYLIGTLLGDLDGPFQIIGRWKNLVLNGLDDQFFYHSVDTIKNIDADELRLLAKKYLNPDDFYELVVV